jgi:hypothetical protein
LRSGDQIRFWPLVFSHGEKTTSQGVNSSVRWSTLRPRQVASSQGIVLFKPIQISGFPE